MPLEQRRRTGKPNAHTLDLPPPFRLVVLREVGDAFEHARANAVELGAGTLVFVGRFDIAEFAVVLEPDEPLVSARRAFYAGMIGLVHALAALAPPEKPIAIEWPGTIHVDRGLIGGGRLAWPEGAREDAVPDWLVFGAAIRTVSMTGADSGLHPLATALDEEGFGDVGAEQLVEGFARHFMAAVDSWREDGFAALGKEYISKLAPERGVRWALEENGDLAIQAVAKAVEHRKLLPALAAPSWLDPRTGAPRL